MRPLRAALLLTLFFVPLPTVCHAQKSMNFYLPDTVPDEEAEQPEDTKPEPAPAKDDSSKEKPAAPDKPDDPIEPPAEPAPPPPKPKPRPPKIADIITSKMKSRSVDPPLDPFGLASAFHDRWDFSTFLISGKEELRFRIGAVRARVQNLSRAFTALSDEVALRQRNLNSAALAVYLLGRDQQAWLPLEGRNLTEAQLLAVKHTMLQDVSAMRNALRDYDTLRKALNTSAEELASLEKNGLDAVKPEPRHDDAITVPTAMIAYEKTESVLSDRYVSVAALKAALATEMLREMAGQRQAIASFAPPPPGTQSDERPAATSMPVPSDEVMKNQPRGESLSQPERASTVIVEARINAAIHTVKSGVVVYAGPFRGYGNMVIVEHEKGLFSVYTHLANIQVLERQPVAAGDTLGRAGALPEAGKNGIHFQVRKGKTPLKPEDWLGTAEVAKLIVK